MLKKDAFNSLRIETVLVLARAQGKQVIYIKYLHAHAPKPNYVRCRTFSCSAIKSVTGAIKLHP